MPKIELHTTVDNRDIDDARRLIARAFRRRPRAEATDVVLSTSMAMIYTIMDGLVSSGLPIEQAKSLLTQTIDQAETQIKLGVRP